jgi:thioester reductase-like protein
VTGFLGKILLEKMLRDLPGTSKYFVLIRPKKDCSAEERFASSPPPASVARHTATTPNCAQH